MFRTVVAIVFVLESLTVTCRCYSGQVPAEFAARIHSAVKQSLPLLEIASAETAQRRTCFTCHGQALPAVVFAEAKKHGFRVDPINLRRQIDHTYAHLKRSKKQYADGRGTGGQVDTAGWALWGLEADDRKADDVTDPVVDYLLSKQASNGMWQCSSNRPPSEKSDFAASYLALRAIQAFGRDTHESKVAAAGEKAAKWFETAEPNDTEDRVFQLLSLPYVDLDDRSETLTADLIEQQQPNGGWAQLPLMESDAYATATVLYTLAEGGMEATDTVYKRGLSICSNTNWRTDRGT